MDSPLCSIPAEIFIRNVRDPYERVFGLSKQINLKSLNVTKMTQSFL